MQSNTVRVGRTYPLLQYARNGSNANKFQVWSGLRVDEAGHLQEIPAREVGRRGPALSIEVDEFVVITGSCKAVQCSRSLGSAKDKGQFQVPFQLSFRSHARRITNSQCFSLRNFCFQEGKSRLAAPPGISLPRSAFTARR